jgi:hypothetical protein
MTNQNMELYYYRKLRSNGFYKCAGHGAESKNHRDFYFPFFKNNCDSDSRFESDCLISPYVGDQVGVFGFTQTMPVDLNLGFVNFQNNQ